MKALPPVRPSVQLNAGGNYVEHEQGIAANQARGAARGRHAAAAPAGAPGRGAPARRKPRRASGSAPRTIRGTIRTSSRNSPTVVIGANDPIVMPRGRTNIDFECEFAVVIGRPAKYVPTARAADYIFGYTAHHDVSDRGGRGDRKMGGSDWLIGKNHDTFGPLGPFIVPKEFLKDPMNTRHTMSLNGHGDAGLEHRPDEPQHLRAAVVRVEHRHAQSPATSSPAAAQPGRTSSAPILAGCAPATRRSARSKASAR